MELTLYTIHNAPPPEVRPAALARDWMDASFYQFAYRCLPLNMANAHGWVILNPFAFSATWNGGLLVNDVTIDLGNEWQGHQIPVALFGQGTITFHFNALFRTEPGWNLWVGQAPNFIKHGVQALTGVIETDQSPYSFTMNWRFTAPGTVRFEKDEPVCFLMPVKRRSVADCNPVVRPLSDNPDLHEQYWMWSRKRDAFHEKARSPGGLGPNQNDHWQKDYFRGKDSHGCPFADHETKVKAKPFAQTVST